METYARLLIRVDASQDLGLGHFMRSLALAQAWQDLRGEIMFVMAMHTSEISNRIATERMLLSRISADVGSFEDAAQTIRIARDQDASWIVVDGYQFDYKYQIAIQEAGFRLLLVDDNGFSGPSCADLILNQNLHANTTMYDSRSKDTMLLLGMDYVLLRREFLDWGGWKRNISESDRKILVTLGGTDPQNLTPNVMRSLQEVHLDGLEATVVTASTHSSAELEEVVNNSKFPVRVERNSTNMAALMAWADLAITGAGSTCWEIVFMALPSITMIVASNQELSAKFLVEKGVTFCLGHGSNFDGNSLRKSIEKLLGTTLERKAMAERASLLIDGQGSTRVVRIMRGLP